MAACHLHNLPKYVLSEAKSLELVENGLDVHSI